MNLFTRTYNRNKKLKKLAFESRASKGDEAGAYFDEKKNRYVKINADSKKFLKRKANHEFKTLLKKIDSRIIDIDDYVILNNKKYSSVEISCF